MFCCVRAAKIHLQGQLVIDRDRPEPLALQIAGQLKQFIEDGHVPGGTRLPSTRLLAAELGVSRNTVLTAYEELAAHGCVQSRRGSGVYPVVPPILSGCDLTAVLREAQYPARALAIRDQNGNPLVICY